MEREEIEAAVISAFEITLAAQLKAVRRLKPGPTENRPRKRQGMSQLDLIHDILQRAAQPLHVSEIILRVEKTHGKHLERESIVSALTKKVQRNDRFIRTGKNVFGLKGEN